MPLENCHLQNYDYDLPEERIAQYPAKAREASRLCVMNKGKLEHRKFPDIVEYFREGDCLVINDTKVIPARLFGAKKTGGKVEVFLLEKGTDHEWIVVGRPGRNMRKGEKLFFPNGVTCEIITENFEKGKRVVRFSAPPDELFEIGHVPLPPYIRRDDEAADRDRYQTVYAEKPGAVASPTAGLHFTEDLLKEIQGKGVEIAKTTLHVGLGTFRLIEAEDVRHHKMDKESYSVDARACEIINQTKERGGRVFAAGTTSAKAVETAAQWGLPLFPQEGKSDLFIYPGFEFKIIDALITNFHMPRSTLMLLVSAFAGREIIRNMYEEALKREYRFLSYGDATLLIK
jgi:S-adenosylmethionine:tRNA ribosyltransferase-isomerase